MAGDSELHHLDPSDDALFCDFGSQALYYIIILSDSDYAPGDLSGVSISDESLDLTGLLEVPLRQLDQAFSGGIECLKIEPLHLIVFVRTFNTEGARPVLQVDRIRGNLTRLFTQHDSLC